jgi:hypothetical protein
MRVRCLLIIVLANFGAILDTTGSTRAVEYEKKEIIKKKF